MKTITSVALAGVLTLGLTAAATAQDASPIVPKLGNPYPLNPVATDGSPLPREGVATPFVGRSVGFDTPVGAVADTVGSAVGAAGSVAGAGLDAVGAGVNATGAAVGGF